MGSDLRAGAIEAMSPDKSRRRLAETYLDRLLDYLTEHNGEWADAAAFFKHHHDSEYGPPVSQALLAALREVESE